MYLTVSDSLLGQVIVEDHGVLAVIAEVLSDRGAGVRRKELFLGKQEGTWAVFSAVSTC